MSRKLHETMYKSIKQSDRVKDTKKTKVIYISNKKTVIPTRLKVT